jgi:hypothetical protein
VVKNGEGNNSHMSKISVDDMDFGEGIIRQHQVSAEQPAAQAQPKKSSKLPKQSIKKPKKMPMLVFGAIVFLALVGAGAFGYNQYSTLKAENQRLANPQAAAEDDANRIKNEVALLMELPDEQPTIATVVDVEKLRSQEFFTNAQNGDRVLLFAESKKAVLYRPSSKKIVEVAPINIGDQEGATAGASTTAEPQN